MSDDYLLIQIKLNEENVNLLEEIAQEQEISVEELSLAILTKFSSFVKEQSIQGKLIKHWFLK